MGALDTFISNYDSIVKGFKQILGKRYYIIVRDKKNNNFVCITYDIKGCDALVEKYLKEHGYCNLDVTVSTECFKKNDLRMEELMKYKLVLLDNQLVTYKDVIEKDKNGLVEGFYEEKIPPFGINKYYSV